MTIMICALFIKRGWLRAVLQLVHEALESTLLGRMPTRGLHLHARLDGKVEIILASQ